MFLARIVLVNTVHLKCDHLKKKTFRPNLLFFSLHNFLFYGFDQIWGDIVLKARIIR